MKHVGVNVAADPLFTAAYTGVDAGLVVVTADDPAMHSSQNEQDNRHYAVAAKVPMVEPSDSADARALTRAAFELSEAHDTPVFLRTTTRLSHSKGVVEVAEGIVPEKHAIGFTPQTGKYVMIPANARRRRVAVEQRMAALAEAVETHPANRVEQAGEQPSAIGVITSGVPYTYVKEVLPDADVLKLGIVHPLPRQMIGDFVAAHETVYVIEELDPVIETQLRAWGLGVHGKDTFPAIGEFSPEVLRASLGMADESGAGSTLPVPPRPPGLCPGCPHGTVFDALRTKGMIVSGDIGCYTLGVLPPFGVMDTCVDMGASITMAQGMEAVLRQSTGERPRVAAVIGDSTFAHSGLTGLVNAVWNKSDGLYIVLDNGTTAMTGTQPNPLSGERIGRENSGAVSYQLLAKAIGIPDENFALVDGGDATAITAAVDDLADKTGVRLLCVVGLCVIEAKELKKIGKFDEKRGWRELELLPLVQGGRFDA